MQKYTGFTDQKTKFYEYVNFLQIATLFQKKNPPQNCNCVCVCV